MDCYCSFRGNSTFVLMKYVLILYLVSFLDQSPVVKEKHIVPIEFNTYFECITDGYVKAYSYMVNTGEQRVNEELLAVKFECKGVKVTKT